MSRNPAPLTGLAIGDALGVQFETESPTSVRLTSWKGSYGPSAFHGLKAGQYSDDTQMSLALAEQLLEEAGSYNAEKAAKKYLAWFTSGDCRGMALPVNWKNGVVS